MNEKLQTALDNTESTYSELVEIANEMVNSYTAEVNELIQEATDNIEVLTNENIRQLLLKLALKAYSFGEIKEKSALKAQCAKALKDEMYARQFNSADGSIEARKNTALIESSSEILAESLYDLVYSLLKTKADNINRVVDTLKSVLVSRAAEAKLLAVTDTGMPIE